MIAALDGGTFYHKEALYGPRYRRWLDRIIYAPDLAGTDLDGLRCLIVTDRIHPRLTLAARGRIAALLTRGATVVAMGETRPDLWLDGVGWEYRPTNFWWWRDRGARLGLTPMAPGHTLLRTLTPEDASWHYHGLLFPPAGAETVLALEGEAGAILYDDRTSTPGRIIATTLDPFYHHGSHFMPATTRFLDKFLPWLAGTVR